MSKILLVILSLFLSSCAQISTGLTAIKQANDTVATTLIASVCEITVGAFYRLENSIHKEGIRKLCGGDNQIELKDLEK